MDKLYMFHARFERVYEFGWWGMEIIQTDTSVQFTSKDFQEGLSVRGVQLASMSPDH